MPDDYLYDVTTFFKIVDKAILEHIQKRNRLAIFLDNRGCTLEEELKAQEEWRKERAVVTALEYWKKHGYGNWL